MNAEQFDKGYWENHWTRNAAGVRGTAPVNPYLPIEAGSLTAGTALDAGCGTGTESLWLAERGWRVTGVDISATALKTAAERAAAAGLNDRAEWIEADLTRWSPDDDYDLVVTNYAHAGIGQLPLYRRIASWVAPGGTVLIVGHDHSRGYDSHRHGHHDHPDGATATLDEIAGLFSAPEWRIDARYENTRPVHPTHTTQLHDVIVRAHRLS